MRITCGLTVKLRGRAQAPAKRRGRTLSFNARGAKQQAHHGSLQRLLDGTSPRPVDKYHACGDPTPHAGPENKRIDVFVHCNSGAASLWRDYPASANAVDREAQTYQTCDDATGGDQALVHCRLTVKLRGRTTTPDRRRGRTLSPGARGAKQTTHHGPLQRLLEGSMAEWIRVWNVLSV
jgi:hypothetical protein